MAPWNPSMPIPSCPRDPARRRRRVNARRFHAQNTSALQPFDSSSKHIKRYVCAQISTQLPSVCPVRVRFKALQLWLHEIPRSFSRPRTFHCIKESSAAKHRASAFCRKTVSHVLTSLDPPPPNGTPLLPFQAPGSKGKLGAYPLHLLFLLPHIPSEMKQWFRSRLGWEDRVPRLLSYGINKCQQLSKVHGLRLADACEGVSPAAAPVTLPAIAWRGRVPYPTPIPTPIPTPSSEDEGAEWEGAGGMLRHVRSNL